MAAESLIRGEVVCTECDAEVREFGESWGTLVGGSWRVHFGVQAHCRRSFNTNDLRTTGRALVVSTVEERAPAMTYESPSAPAAGRSSLTGAPAYLVSPSRRERVIGLEPTTFSLGS